MDPHYRDLAALRTDHSALYTQLKLTQQTLQHSYQEVAMAQERSKRAETDYVRLRTQMDIIFKKHVEHHPERESLVQQLAELQSKLDIELGTRQILEKGHTVLQQELLRYKLNSAVAKSAPGTNRSLSCSTPSPPAPTSITSSVQSSTFSSFLAGASRRSKRSSVSSAMTMTTTSDYRGQAAMNSQRPSAEEISPELKSIGARDMEVKTVQDLDHENLADIQSQLPTWEQLEVEKLFYERLRDENVAMKIDLQDLRHRNKVEKDSIKGYMSLFESLQKKQANALAVSQSELDLARASLQEYTIRLESRESLIQTFAATVNSQAVDFEILTKESSREKAARAKCEQEMASLLEASLLMLERWYSNVQQAHTRILTEALNPIRQTIQYLEVPSIQQEWELCEQGVKRIMDEMAVSLVFQQESQEQELIAQNSTPRSSSATAAVNTNIDCSQRNMSELPPTASLDSNHSQQVFVWHKFKADSFLEECVKSVESLAQEKKVLQTRIVELKQTLALQEEKRHLAEAVAKRQSSSELAESDDDKKTLSTEVDVNSAEEPTMATESHEKMKEIIPTGDEEQSFRVQSEEYSGNICTGQSGNMTHGPESTKGIAILEKARARRFEAILKRVLEWSDLQESEGESKQNTTSMTTGDIEDDVLFLGISNAAPAMDDQQCLTAVRTEMDDSLSRTMGTTQSSIGMAKQRYYSFPQDKSQSRNEDLNALIQLIRQELLTTPSGQNLTEDDKNDTEVIVELTPEPVAESCSKRKPHPGAITTMRQNPIIHAALPSPSYTTPRSSCSISSYSSTSSSSCYFPPTVSLGGLSTPVSPSLGGFGGPDGQTILSMDALCHDLAFRSFPKQYQWSKSTNIRKGTPHLTWLPSSSSLKPSSALPPLPPSRPSSSSSAP
ncbi:hypothetical protein BG011_004516 [Mortierella polycephala]|uniref:Uncharacterized protein n=1 Tax=Mortierella polycephala TaxID=41804 RepID=A0A9P6QJX9_9FUNG|nr:hypothetical protein BG011_004516 [Mortierella polycephala]